MTTLFISLLVMLAPIFGVLGLLEKARDLQTIPSNVTTTEV